jgi:hypothetical protein
MDGDPPADDENGWVPRNDADRFVVPGEPILRIEQLCPRRDARVNYTLAWCS